MPLEDLCILSYYRKVADIDKDRHVYLVQHVENQHFYVQKELTIYKKEIYEWLKQLDSNYFPRIYECIETRTEGEQLCLVVIEEYIQGENYKEILEREGSLPEREVLRTGIWLCQALSTLHSLNPPVIHRDIKPSNLIRQREGQLCLIDFNTAKAYENWKKTDTIAIGTIDFAAPEQFGYTQSDIRTDIYGIAASMNYLLTGKTVKQQRYQPNDTVNDYQLKLAGILQKGTAFDPNARYQNVEEMKLDLEKCMELECSKQTLRPKYMKKTKPSMVSDPSSSWHRFLPPGFRKLRISHMAAAILGYLFILWIGLSLEVTSINQTPATGTELWINRICCTGMMLHLIFFLCDYLEMRTKSFLIKRTENKYFQLLLSIPYIVLIMAFWIFILALLENIFFS